MDELKDEVESKTTEGEIESDVEVSRVTLLAHKIQAPREHWQGELSTSELASACAELDVELDADQERVDEKKRALLDARRLLAERFTNEGISQIRVETTDGRKLVHLAAINAMSVPAERREAMLAWLKANHPELLREDYVPQTLVSNLKRWQSESEGEFPQGLVDSGVIKVYTGVEVRFRKSK